MEAGALLGPSEVPAPPAAQCWRCRGAGSRLAKTTPGAPPLPRPCATCRATGLLSRAPPRTAARPLKAFAGWAAPGPAPAGALPRPLAPCEELCYLVGRWQVLQRTDSHRYSTDDVVTAWAAWRALGALRERPAAAAPPPPPPPPPLRTADIGCGIGSVLLMTAWLHPHALCVGAEAQPGRAACARASIALNCGAAAAGSGGGAQRVALVEGDLRAAATQSALQCAVAALEAPPAPGAAAPRPLFDLVTGTPPYFPVADGGLPPHEESARCLFEYRGGVEGYCAAAAALLQPQGLFAVCQTSRELLRTYAAARAAGLAVLGRVDVVPVQGKPPLFFVLLCSRQGAALSLPAAALALPLQQQQQQQQQQHLPHADMRQPAYAAWLEGTLAAAAAAAAPASADAEGGEGEGEGGGGGGGGGGGECRAKPKQAARGSHVDFCGKALEGESVATLLVRDASGQRTPQYRTMLWEMGKPS